MKPQHRDNFNDGYLQYGYRTTQYSETGKRLGEVFEMLGTLAFEEMSCRDQDYLLANALGSRLDLKVRTMLPPTFKSVDKSKLKVSIGTEKFDIVKIDTDRNKNYLYFYLQKVGA